MINSILEKVRSARELKNISQQDIADELEITQSSYAKMERGYCKMNVDNLIKIAKYLQIDISALFNASSQSNIHTVRNDLSSNQQLENTINHFTHLQLTEIAEIKKIVTDLKELRNILVSGNFKTPIK